MQGCCPQVFCSVLFVLLLRSPVLLVIAQSFPNLHPKPLYSYHENFIRFFDYEELQGRQSLPEDEILQYCDGDFDIYFVFDSSKSVGDWTDFFTSWEDMVEKYLNPKLRMSFILFNGQAQMKMPLTADRNMIRSHLSGVREVYLLGPTFLHTGLKKANEQIQKVNSQATKRSSLIITVVWGKLTPQEVKESKREANKARSMGAYVYCVGLGDYNRKQMNEIADSQQTVFIVQGSSKMLHELVDTIGTMACLELRYVEPSPLCIGESQPVILKGYGFHNGKSLDKVICRFTFSNTKIIDENPIEMNSTVMVCPSPKIKQPGETISVEVSLNDGRDFLANTIQVNTSDCTIPPVTTAVPETSTLPPKTTPPETSTPKTSPTTRKTTTTTTTTMTTTTTTTTTTPKIVLPPKTTPVQTTTPPPPPPPPRPLPPPPPPPPPPHSPPPLHLPPNIPDEPSEPVLLSTVVLVLLLIPVLLWWVWWLCCRRPSKAPPAPVPQPEKPKKKKPPPPSVPPPAPAPPVTVSPTVIVCCCACQGVFVSRDTETDVTLCNFHLPSCHQLPLTWSQCSNQGQCTNLAVLKNACSQALYTHPVSSLPPGQESLSLTTCYRCHHLSDSCSRLPPLLSHSAGVAPRAPLSLPPMKLTSQAS